MKSRKHSGGQRCRERITVASRGKCARSCCTTAAYEIIAECVQPTSANVRTVGKVVVEPRLPEPCGFITFVIKRPFAIISPRLSELHVKSNRHVVRLLGRRLQTPRSRTWSIPEAIAEYVVNSGSLECIHGRSLALCCHGDSDCQCYLALEESSETIGIPQVRPHMRTLTVLQPRI